MELGGGGPAAGPGPAALGRGGLEFLQHTVGSLLANYGWYILLAAVAIYFLVQKISQGLAGRPGSLAAAADAAVALQTFSNFLEPDVVVRRQEALAAARLRMQEELNAQAERYKEKHRQLEEEKRRQKIAMWESMQEGKSYKGNLKLNQQEVESGASTSSAVPKSKPNKKPLRGGGYNPLSGEGGGTCSWRPGRRGPSAGG
ncbi:selenoprotein S isoform X1 [Falco biarmicus]|uniref:selenoprotein S isoform X1 n=1 Tax=Falco biarmicus TaxID=345155 RepID=UPI0024BCCAD8|nr:selenoprotein S isoform X1 [Falco biarmicus]